MKNKIFNFKTPFIYLWLCWLFSWYFPLGLDFVDGPNLEQVKPVRGMDVIFNNIFAPWDKYNQYREFCRGCDNFSIWEHGYYLGFFGAFIFSISLLLLLSSPVWRNFFSIKISIFIRLITFTFSIVGLFYYFGLRWCLLHDISFSQSYYGNYILIATTFVLNSYLFIECSWPPKLISHKGFIGDEIEHANA